MVRGREVALTKLCETPTCLQGVSKGLLRNLLEGVRLEGTLDDLHHTRDPYGLMAAHGRARRAVESTIGPRAGNLPPSPADHPLLTYARSVWERVQDLQERGEEILKSQAWQEMYLQDQSGRESLFLSNLKKAGLGGPQDMGMLVGPVVPQEALKTRDSMLLAQLHQVYQGNGNIVTLLPLGVMEVFFYNHLIITDGCVGYSYQVMDVPEDLDLEVLEALTGVFTPRGEGPLKRLPQALHAARLLLGR